MKSNTMSIENKEQVYFEDDGIKVTSSWFVSGKKTFAMRNISSVSIGRIKPNIGLPDLLIFVSVVLLLLSQFLLGALSFVLGVGIIIKSKPKYVIMIATDKKEVKGLVSKDLSHVEAIVEAVNQSVVKYKLA